MLSAVIFGTAAVTGAGLNAVQTQSYGSEVRGSECQAELILSEGPIYSPLSDQVDILVAMSQSALDRYLGGLKSGGPLLLDPELVEKPTRPDIKVLEVSATQIANKIGEKLVANMVMLGFLQQATGLISEDHLHDAIRANVPQKFLKVNLEAAKCGIALAKDQEVCLQV